MIQVHPLRGILYSRDKIRDFSRVITPPHDSITKAEEETYRARSEHNFIHLDLPEGGPERYAGAGERFRDWRDRGILVREEHESFYLYSQTYRFGDRDCTRSSFIGLLELQPLGMGVLPHEKILEKDLQDRISLISATRAQFGIPLLLYTDREGRTDRLLEREVAGVAPYLRFTDDDGVTHRLWPVHRAGFVRELQDAMAGHRCVIADGHHRYQSELQLRERLGSRAAGYGLMCFTNACGDGMAILPTNRVAFGLDLEAGSWRERLCEYFVTEVLSSLDLLVERVIGAGRLREPSPGSGSHVLGLHDARDGKNHLLTLKDSASADRLLADQPELTRNLDVQILHEIVIKRILGITEDQQKRREHIDFIKGNRETVERLRRGDAQLGFFVNPPSVSQVLAIAQAGAIMPQKSTFFYPKVFSGLIIHALEAD